MNKILINKILKNYLINESLIVDDSDYINEIEDINNLDEKDYDLENKLDKIWNSLEIDTKKKGIDMSKFKSSVNDKLKMLVDKLATKSKNPAVWLRRKLVCDLWK